MIMKVSIKTLAVVGGVVLLTQYVVNKLSTITVKHEVAIKIN